MLVEAFLAAILVTVIGLASSYFVQILIDSVLVHSERKLLNALAIGMIGLLLFRILFGIVRAEDDPEPQEPPRTGRTS